MHIKPDTKFLFLITFFGIAFGCNKPDSEHHNLPSFQQVNLVANSSEYHPVTVDPAWLKPFGIAWSPTGIAWVNSVGSHVSELYSSGGAVVRKPVNIPAATDTSGGLPCGIVFSGGQGFNLSNGPSLFLFIGFDGMLSGWNPASGNTAKRLKSPSKSNYTGLAIAANNRRNLIYGSNFGANKIDIWDTTFSLVKMPFKDPGLPADYLPYNIQVVGNQLFVMYAQLSTTV